MQRPSIRAFWETLLAFALCSAVYWSAFLLVANLSFYWTDAAIFTFGTIVLISFVRFILWGNQGWGPLVAGVALSWAWFLIGFAVLDWAVANGPSPKQVAFYTSAMRLLVTPEALLVFMVPAGVVALATLLGYTLASLASQLRSRFTAPRPHPGHDA
jgi:hypothetical protein